MWALCKETHTRVYRLVCVLYAYIPVWPPAVWRIPLPGHHHGFFPLSERHRLAPKSLCSDSRYNNRATMPVLNAGFRRGGLPQAQIRARGHAHTHSDTHCPLRNKTGRPSSWLMKGWQEEKYHFTAKKSAGMKAFLSICRLKALFL